MKTELKVHRIKFKLLLLVTGMYNVFFKIGTTVLNTVRVTELHEVLIHMEL